MQGANLLGFLRSIESKTGRGEIIAVFEVYFRDMPFKNGYAVFAGLERVISYLKALQFDADDITYLRELGYPESFLTYLSEMTFTCDVKSAKEGDLVFANRSE